MICVWCCNAPRRYSWALLRTVHLCNTLLLQFYYHHHHSTHQLYLTSAVPAVQSSGVGRRAYIQPPFLEYTWKKWEAEIEEEEETYLRAIRKANEEWMRKGSVFGLIDGTFMKLHCFHPLQSSPQNYPWSFFHHFFLMSLSFHSIYSCSLQWCLFAEQRMNKNSF